MILLLQELEKFSKFYDCSIRIAPQDIYGKQSNDSFSKHLGKAESNFDEVDWETETMRNFCFDISANYSGKYRLDETGYDTEKFVSSKVVIPLEIEPKSSPITSERISPCILAG